MAATIYKIQEFNIEAIGFVRAIEDYHTYHGGYNIQDTSIYSEVYKVTTKAKIP